MKYDIKKFVEENYEEINEDVIDKLLKYGYSPGEILSNFDIDEDIIYEKSALLEYIIDTKDYNFSQEFIIKLIDEEHLTKNDLINIPFSSYLKFDKNFIEEYKEYIAWDKVIFSMSVKNENVEEYIDVIEENNLWNYISGTQLPIDFIRKYKDKLDWSYVSLLSDFSEEEMKEFEDYIVKPEINNEIQKKIDTIINRHDRFVESIQGIESILDDNMRNKYFN